jgi:hypothetical protein
MLVRAKSAPLYLEGRILFPLCDDVQFGIFQKELQSRMHQISHLHFILESARLYSKLEVLESPAPNLEYLSLSSRNTYTEEKTFIPDSLFDGCTPMLSCLKLRNCDISWKSPLLKGLKYLNIRMPSKHSRPTLAIWLESLDALGELPQLKALTLHSASPIAPPTPFFVERTPTLPSLTHLDISASAKDCALALAHLDLPALICLYLTVKSRPVYSDVRNLLPYVARHAHGPQDTHPLQSVYVCNYEGQNESYLDVLAWSVSDIDAEVHDPPALLGATLSPRVALAIESKGWIFSSAHLDIFEMVMAALPLGDLVMLAAQDLRISSNLAKDLSRPEFWLRRVPQWPLLRRVRLAPPVVRGFLQMLLEDNGERERPLLPSLAELVVHNESSSGLSELPICDILMKRVEQGVPLDMLDLRMCYHDNNSRAAVQLFSESAVNVLGPIPDNESLEERRRMRSMWDALAHGLFIENDIFEEATHSETDDDGDSVDSDIGGGDGVQEDEEW